MTPHKTPAPPPADEDWFFRLLGGLFRGAVALLRYLLRRTLRHPLVGLLYLSIALPAALLLIQHGRFLLAIATAPPFTDPDPVFPLSTPLPDPVPALLLGLIALVIGFDRWCAWRAQPRPQRTAPPAVPPPDVCVLGRAYIRVWDAERMEFTQTPGDLFTLGIEHLRTHLIVVAPPGAGKTTSILVPIFALSQRQDAAVLVFDAKGDGRDWSPGWFDRTFDLSNPARSMPLNLWSGQSPRQMGEQLGEAIIDLTSLPYFLDSARLALAGLSAAHYAVHRHMPSLRDLLIYLQTTTRRHDLIADLGRAGYAATSDEALDVARIDTLAESKNDPLGNIINALTPLARGVVADIVRTDGTGYRVDELLQQGQRVRLVLPVADYPRLAPIIGRLVLAQFTNAVLSPRCRRDQLKMVIVDEAHNFITPAIAKGMAMARANLGSYVLAVQDLAQVTDPTLRENLFSVAGNKVVMAGAGEQDAQKFSAIFGQQEREYRNTSTSASIGTTHSSSRGQGGGGGLLSSANGVHHQTSRATGNASTETAGTSRTFRLRPTFLPAELRFLPPFHAVIERRSNTGEITPATVVHLDRALVEAIQEAQAYQRYQQTQRANGSRPAPATPQSALQPAAPHATQTLALTRATSSAEAARAATPPLPSPAGATQEHVLEDSTTRPTPAALEETGSTDEQEAADWTTTVAAQIATTLSVDADTAAALVATAQDHGRGADYLEDLLAYVQDNPRVEHPVAMFQRLVETNAVRRRPAAPAPESPEGQS